MEETAATQPIKEEILRIDAPHFCADIVLYNKEVVQVAPILRYMHGWQLQRVIGYVRKKGWKWEKTEHYVDAQTKPSAYIGRINEAPRKDYRVQRGRQKNNNRSEAVNKSLH